tara:strand:- start:144 stop:341 length:198 start_codon:yes stop_codon:yes gene_type:complete
MKRPYVEPSSLLHGSPYKKLVDQYIDMLESKIKDQAEEIEKLENQQGSQRLRELQIKWSNGELEN